MAEIAKGSGFPVLALLLGLLLLAPRRRVEAVTPPVAPSPQPSPPMLPGPPPQEPTPAMPALPSGLPYAFANLELVLTTSPNAGTPERPAINVEFQNSVIMTFRGQYVSGKQLLLLVTLQFRKTQNYQVPLPPSPSGDWKAFSYDFVEPVAALSLEPEVLYEASGRATVIVPPSLTEALLITRVATIRTGGGVAIKTLSLSYI